MADYSKYYLTDVLRKNKGDKQKAIQHVKSLSDADFKRMGVNRATVLKGLGAPLSTPPHPTTKPVPKPTPKPKSWLQNFTSAAKPYVARAATFGGKVLDTLNKPLYGVTNAMKNITDNDDDLFKKAHPITAFKQGWSGQAKTTFKDVYNAMDASDRRQGRNPSAWYNNLDPIRLPIMLAGEAMGKSDDSIRKAGNAVMGFGTDLFAFPTGLGVGGLTKTGRVAELLQKGQLIKGDSALGKEITMLAAKDPQAVKLATTPSQQAALGQRSLVSMFGTPVLPKAVNVAGFKALEKAGNTATNVIKANPWMLAGARTFSKDFGLSQEGKAAKELDKKYTRLERVGKQDAVKTGQELKKTQDALNSDPASLFDMAERLKMGKEAKFNIARNSGLNSKQYKIADPNYKLSKLIEEISPEVQRKAAEFTKTVPDVFNIAQKEAAKKGADLNAVINKAQKYPSLKSYLDDLKTTNHYKQVAGIAPNAPKAAPGTYRGAAKEFAGLPKDVKGYLTKLHEMNKTMLADEKAAGINISELTNPDYNYMYHKLTQEMQKKIGNKNTRSKLAEPLQKWLHKTNGVFFGKSGHSILSPNAIERKYDMPVSEVNKLAQEGKLEGGLAGRNIDKLFIDDPATAMTHRLINHVQTTQRAKFLDEAAAQFGKSATPELEAQGYRKIQSAQFGDKLDGLVFQAEVAPVVEKQLKFFDDPAEVDRFSDAFWKAFDFAQSIWKKYNLVTVPAYHIRNIAGNFWMNYLGGVVNPKTYGEAATLLAGKPGEIKTAAGHTLNFDQVKQLAQQEGIVDRGWFKSEFGDNVADAMQQSKSILHRVTHPVDTGVDAQATVENWSRYTHFMEKLKEGYSPDAAAQSVKKFLYDYDNLTDFEATWMRRVFPFYAWSRHNIPLEVTNLITQPGKASTATKAIANIENHYDEQDGRPNERWMPEWLSESMPVYAGTDDTGKGRYFQTKYWLPLADIQDLPKMVTRQGFLPEWAAENMTPLAKIPMDINYNTSSYFESPISRLDSGQYTNFLGMELPAKLVYGLRSFVRPLNELDKLNPGNVFGERVNQPSQQERLMNALLGLRFNAYDPAQQARFYRIDAKDELENIRALYRTAQRNKNVREQKILEEKYNALMNDPRTKELAPPILYYTGGMRK